MQEAQHEVDAEDGCWADRGPRLATRRRDGAQGRLGVERIGDGLDQAVVVDQPPTPPDEKLSAAADLEVEDRLDAAAVDRRTRAVPPSIRRVSPGLRSRAMVQPRPNFQNRWMPVATIDSSPRVTRNVALGGL